MKKQLLIIALGALALSVSAADVFLIDVRCPNPPVVVKADTPFDATLRMQNIDPKGSGDVYSMDVTFAPEGGTPVTRTITLDEPLKSSATDVTVHGFVCDIIGEDIPATFTVSNVNGTDKPNAGNGASFRFTSACETYPACPVFEESTGEWCTFCYDAYLGMEYMHENYMDKGFIGIAVHTQDRYAPGYKLPVTGQPNGFWNRDYTRQVKPTQAGLEAYFNKMAAIPSVYGVDAQFEVPTGTVLDLKTVVSFGTSVTGRTYKMAYILTEDNLIGNQKSPDGYKVVKYNDIARDGSVFTGVDIEEIPSDVEAYSQYTIETTLDLSKLSDVSNGYVSVLLLDGETGHVLNATRQPLNGNRLVITGVEKVAVDNVTAGAEPVYYDLQGRAVSGEPAPGLYIRRCGNKTDKVLVK